MAETEDKFLLLSHVDDIRDESDDRYVKKVSGKGLSSEDYTSVEKTKLSGIEEGAEKNVITGVSANGTAIALANGIANLLMATGSADGSIAFNGVDITVKGIAALAYKSKVSADDLADALKTVIDGKAEASVLNAIIGDDANKTIRAISAEEVAKIVAGADEDFDTLKEIADWIMSDTTGAAKMVSDISALKTKLTLGTHEVEGEQVEYTDVKAYVEGVVAGLGLGNYVEKVEGKGLSTNDYTDADKTKLGTIAENAQVNVIEEIEINGTAASISSKKATITLPVATSSEVKARFAAAGN